MLAFGDLAAGGGTSPDQADRAVSAFANAIRADPADEAAKFDLELLLRLFRGARGADRGDHGRRARTARAGAGRGTGIPGAGY